MRSREMVEDRAKFIRRTGDARAEAMAGRGEADAMLPQIAY